LTLLLHAAAFLSTQSFCSAAGAAASLALPPAAPSPIPPSSVLHRRWLLHTVIVSFTFAFAFAALDG
jgi:hypothetical protein